MNIFLKQFRKPTDVIIDLLRSGDPRSFGVEKLKGLSKLLPQPDEVTRFICMKYSVQLFGDKILVLASTFILLQTMYVFL